jgi:single-stranded-DNA-specific exonuclease
MASDLADLVNDIGNNDFIWSQQNDAPKIHVTDINLRKSDIQVIGKTGNTVKFEKNGITYIQFFANDLIEDLNNYDDIKLEIVGTAKLNEWGGRVTKQIIIKDYEVKNGECEF